MNLIAALSPEKFSRLDIVLVSQATPTWVLIKSVLVYLRLIASFSLDHAKIADT